MLLGHLTALGLLPGLGTVSLTATKEEGHLEV